MTSTCVDSYGHDTDPFHACTSAAELADIKQSSHRTTPIRNWWNLPTAPDAWRAAAKGGAQ